MLGSNECSVTRAKEKLCLNESAKQRLTGNAVEAPQPLGLRRGQAESGHFDVLTLNALKHVDLLLCHVEPPWFGVLLGFCVF
jgi:hypothetical protein